MALDRSSLVNAIARLTPAMDAQFDRLNEADAKLGDGDLGITMTRGMKLVEEIVADLPDDLGLAMLNCSKAFTKSSGSSYGTLVAIGMMAIAKEIKGENEIEPSRLSGLVMAAMEQMKVRGKAELGGKTVLDSLHAVAKAISGKTDIDDIRAAASQASKDVLDEFRDKTATIGRARMFGEKSIGLDDPGMLAMKFVVCAIADTDA
ncbi:dihydroxyacetone kinase subunit L [Alphaproteobacteria bacterium]|jgi:phosphoenolpyruvate---glycerone phosphotransferase subunit DhaL|nr:dihydroxyacetone kinase subunit L [Alphaproteobacteria bacterium]